jgi:hypothetical protein
VVTRKEYRLRPPCPARPATSTPERRQLIVPLALDLIRSLRELALALGAVYDGSVADLRMVARGVPPTPHPHRSSPTRADGRAADEERSTR